MYVLESSTSHWWITLSVKFVENLKSTNWALLPRSSCTQLLMYELMQRGETRSKCLVANLEVPGSVSNVKCFNFERIAPGSPRSSSGVRSWYERREETWQREEIWQRTHSPSKQKPPHILCNTLYNVLFNSLIRHPVRPQLQPNRSTFPVVGENVPVQMLIPLPLLLVWSVCI